MLGVECERLSGQPLRLTPTLQNCQYVVTDTIVPGATNKFYMLKFISQ